MSGTRELILERIRGALGAEEPAPQAPVARDYRRHGELEPAAKIELLCERIGDYGAEVRRVGAGELAEVIAEVLETKGARRVCVPAGIPPQWRSDAFEWVADDELSLTDLDRVDGVLTCCTLAIAQTGTIALRAGAAEGRRAITLVPDLHICVIAEDQVVETVPEAIALLGELVATKRSPITFISGPSATSDIELNRVEGVHGPSHLTVLVVHGGSPKSVADGSG